MSVHLQTEIEKLKRNLLALGTLVEENLHLAIKAFKTMDTTAAKQVLHTEKDVDLREIDVEEECLKIMALHRPVATDLRFIVALLKINNDLERIGDLAANFAKRILKISESDQVEHAVDFTPMFQIVSQMLKTSLDSLVNSDVVLARSVVQSDNEVDGLKKGMRREIKALLSKHPEDVSPLLNSLSIVHYLERIGDLATNIAEDVIYLVEGKIIRHQWIADQSLAPELE